MVHDECICQSLCQQKRTQEGETKQRNRETEKCFLACLLVCCLHPLYVSIISERGTVTTILSITTNTHYMHYRLHYTTLHTLHYTTLQYITIHYTTLHYTTLHYTTLHYSTLHYTTLCYTTLHYTTLHYTTLHYTTLHSKQFTHDQAVVSDSNCSNCIYQAQRPFLYSWSFSNLYPLLFLLRSTRNHPYPALRRS